MNGSLSWLRRRTAPNTPASIHPPSSLQTLVKNDVNKIDGAGGSEERAFGATRCWIVWAAEDKKLGGEDHGRKDTWRQDLGKTKAFGGEVMLDCEDQ